MFKKGNIIKYGNAMGITIVDDFGHYYTLKDSRGNMDRVEKMIVNTSSMLMTDFIKQSRPYITKMTNECFIYISRNAGITLPVFVKSDIRSIVEAFFTQDYKKAERSELYIKQRNIYYSALNWVKSNCSC